MPHIKPSDAEEFHVTRVQTGELTLVKNVPPKLASFIIINIESIHEGQLELKRSESANEPIGQCVIEMVSGIRIEVTESYSVVKAAIGI